jgi:hypothetical protein
VSALAKTNTLDEERRSQKKADALAALEILHQEIHRDPLDAEELDDKIAIAHALVESL